MNWNEIRHLHRRPQIVALWRRLLGPLLSWLTPSHRRLALGLGAFAVALRLSIEAVEPEHEWHDLQAEPAIWIPLALLMSAYVAICYLVARRYASLPLFMQRRPLVFQHGTFWILLVASWNTNADQPMQRAIFAGCAGLMPFLLWRLCYLLQQAQRGRMAGSGLLDHALYVWPLWGGTDTPYGKGLD